MVELKRLGKAKIEHKPPIASEDLQKCTRAVHLTPQHRQVFRIRFEVMLFFCRRGQENLRELKADTFGHGVAKGIFSSERMS